MVYSRMTDPSTEGPPAGLELLDLAPPPPPRGPHWERILGLLLVLGIAAAGGWQWISAGTQHSAYRTAVQAETAQDWDRALAAYGHAADYNDSAIRRANVAAIIHERDTAYAAASRAFARQDWAALLPALLPLERLAPTYRDTPRFVAARDTAVYTPALSGTVALRPSAQPPGLYTYRTGWHWLTGSDIHSQIVGRCPNGDWLLDVALPPLPGATPRPTPLPSARNDTRLAGRRLALVSIEGTARQLLDPALNDREFYLCDRRQVWGMQLQPLDSAGQGPYMAIFTGTRQSLIMTQAQVPPVPGPSWFFGTPAADGRHILLIDTTGVAPARQQLGLTLADPDGRHLRALGTFAGTLQANHFSPDGRWLLVILQNSGPLPTSPERERVLLFDLSSTQAPLLLEEVQRAADRADTANYLYALFLLRPPYAGRICIIRSGATPRLRLVAPDGSAPDQTYDVPQPFAIARDPAVDPASGQLLLSGTSGDPTGSRAPNSFVVLAPPDTVTLRVVPLPPGYWLQEVLPRAGRLLYVGGAESNYQFGTPQAVTLYSLPLTALGNPPLAPTAVYSGTRTLNASQFFNSWHAGAAWLAYATPTGELHVRRYDGTGDVLLERGVSGFAATFAYLTGDDP